MQPRHLPYHARRVELPQAGFRLFVRPGLKTAPKKSLSQALRRAVPNLVINGTERAKNGGFGAKFQVHGALQVGQLSEYSISSAGTGRNHLSPEPAWPVP